jgi:thioesterase domain-containing protein
MARRLEAEGQKVALLGILDTWVLENTYSHYWYLEHYARRASLFLRMSPRDQLEFIKKKSYFFRAVLNVTAGEGPTSRPRKINSVHQTYFPGAKFVPPAYGGRISIFRVRRQPLNRIRDPQLGWGRLARGGVELHSVPGGHSTLTQEPYVGRLAEELKKCLLTDKDTWN